ncbi:hypothetical protein FQN54_006676 [Arachnomyces sp. PD_36]|nr:hypothetical protein FQN54_006676 [Arachnomyces sp. PD_36]
MSDYYDSRARRRNKSKEEPGADDILFASGSSNTNNKPQTNLFGAISTPNANPANTTSAGGGGLGMGGLLGGLGTNSATTSQPQTKSLFPTLGAPASQAQSGAGSATTQPAQTGSNMFSGLGIGTGGQQQQQQPQQSGASAGGMFSNLGASTTQQQPAKSLFGGVGQSTAAPAGGGLFGASQQQQQQQQQKPTLSLFGDKNAAAQPQQQQQPSSNGQVVPGVKIDVSNLVPTTKFENCSDELKKSIEDIDKFILGQIRMCNEVSDFLPSIASTSAMLPNDVEFVQGKLDTMQQALENDASEIDYVRTLVTRDANEAKVGFRAIDSLTLPTPYQPSSSGGWWSSPTQDQQQQQQQHQSLRSVMGTRKSLFALPEEAEADASSSTNGGANGPVNLIDYFSQQADDMDSVLSKYQQNIKEIEDHLHGVEVSLARQINDFVATRSRDGSNGGNGGGMSSSRARDLAAAFGDVERGILGVAGRLGGAREEVQEVVLGPVGGGGSALGRFG